MYLKTLSAGGFSGITAIGMDETSARKDHKYITFFPDIDTGRIVYLCAGKDTSTLKSFSESLESHNSSSDRIINICCDMSPAFISGISEHFPSSSITFDKFISRKWSMKQ